MTKAEAEALAEHPEVACWETELVDHEEYGGWGVWLADSGDEPNTIYFTQKPDGSVWWYDNEGDGRGPAAKLADDYERGIRLQISEVADAQAELDRLRANAPRRKEG